MSKSQYDRHHRLPVSRGGDNHTPNGRNNIVKVKRQYHRAWHLLFGNCTPTEIAKLVTDVWIDPDYYLVALPRDRKSVKGRRKRVYCSDCDCVVLQKAIPKKQV